MPSPQAHNLLKTPVDPTRATAYFSRLWKRRAVAQLGRGLRSGRRGRGFESRQPDHPDIRIGSESAMTGRHRSRADPAFAPLPPRFRPVIPPYPHETPVRACGRSLDAATERHPNPEKIDHLMVRLDVAGAELTLSLNTRSFRNRAAGFDDRVWIALPTERMAEQPQMGLQPSALLNYEVIEARAEEPVVYIPMHREAAEKTLRDAVLGASLVEAWGLLYTKRGLGLHQIHSRRASCGVAEDLRGRDGGLRVTSASGQFQTWVLLKFCGQLRDG